METGLIAGLLVFLLSAVCNGAFAFPQKFVKNFAWENTWGTFWFFAMVVIPLIVMPFLVQNVTDTWSTAGTAKVINTILFGSLWGLGCITFGIGISAIGLSLGFSIIMGLAIGIGSFLPLITKHPEVINTPAGYVSIAGIIVSILGVAICGYAGVLKERSLEGENSDTTHPQKKAITKGMLICLLSGFLSACLNLGFDYAEDITKLASTETFGNPQWCAGLVTWILLFTGGFLVCGPVSIVMLFKNGTWSNFRSPDIGRNLSLTFSMGLLQFGVIFLYGVGAFFLGDLGTSLGYALFMSLGIIVANLLGFISGEWKGASRQSINWIITALVILILGICLLSIADTMK